MAHRFPLAVATAAMLLTQSLYAEPLHTVITLRPNDSSPTGLMNIESVPVLGTWDGAPGTTGGSFLTTITGAEKPNAYTQIYFDLELAFGRDLQIQDLASVVYHTKKEAGAGDWVVRIYTEPLGGQTGGWYGYRFDAKTPSSNTEWNAWDLNDGNWFSQALGGGNTPTVSGLNSTLLGLHDGFGNRDLLYFSLYIGSSSNGNPISSYLGSMTVTLSSGESVEYQFIPEPGSFALLFGGIGLLWIWRRRHSDQGRGRSAALRN